MPDLTRSGLYALQARIDDFDEDYFSDEGYAQRGGEFSVESYNAARQPLIDELNEWYRAYAAETDSIAALRGE